MLIYKEEKIIQLKIVYHGVGLGGKTTNLQQIFSRVRPEQRLSQAIVEIPTQEDKTLTFDLLPLSFSGIRGYTTQFSFYTVPGQVHYKYSRKLILEGVDGVVFVADSQPMLRNENMRMLQELKDYLKELECENIPLVFQFNKRDLPLVMKIEQMKRDLLVGEELCFEACAIKGIGVMETMQAIVQLSVASYLTT